MVGTNYRFEPIAYRRTSWTHGERTLADDMAEHPAPVDTTEHVHFHGHGGRRHAHAHVHPEGHAHSALTNLPAHEGER